MLYFPHEIGSPKPTSHKARGEAERTPCLRTKHHSSLKTTREAETKSGHRSRTGQLLFKKPEGLIDVDIGNATGTIPGGNCRRPQSERPVRKRCIFLERSDSPL